MTKKKKICVLAFGGNAILRADDEGTQKDQERRAAQAARVMVGVIENGWELLVVHGNGPQVGNELLRSEEAATKTPPDPLDACVAKTQGGIGYLLECALRNACLARGIRKPAATVLSMVRVDPRDPRFRQPSKPIGPYYSLFRARQLMGARGGQKQAPLYPKLKGFEVLQKNAGWPMIEVPGRGWRRVVVSPRPVELLSMPLIRSLLAQGAMVIAAGGGGVPVRRKGKKWVGVEAVIDKDYTAALLADSVDAGLFVILTEVDRVALCFGKPEQKDLSRLRLAEARRGMKAGEFPPGSMGPKVEACMRFISQKKGREALITSARRLRLALKGKHGTRITR